MSHHDILQPVTRAALGNSLPPAGHINTTQYSFVEQDGRFDFEVDPPSMPDKYQLWPLDFAFGSGATGLTFVSMLEGRNVVEMKMSYFPGNAGGVSHRAETGQSGVGGKFRQSGSVSSLPGVSYNRDVEEYLYAETANSMEWAASYVTDQAGAHRRNKEWIQGSEDGRLKHMGATELNTLCGECHRLAKDVAGTSKEQMTYRFQPYGLMQKSPFSRKRRSPLLPNLSRRPHECHEGRCCLRSCMPLLSFQLAFCGRGRRACSRPREGLSGEIPLGTAFPVICRNATCFPEWMVTSVCP